MQAQPDVGKAGVNTVRSLWLFISTVERSGINLHSVTIKYTTLYRARY